MVVGSDAVLHTARGSLAVQFVFTGVTAGALFLTVPDEYEILRSIAILETVSQIIEFVWYALVVFRFRNIKTWTRYLDWYISTPTMLISTVAFFIMIRQQREDASADRYGRLSDVVSQSNLGWTVAILVINQAMLTCGLLVERSILNPTIGLPAGFMLFIAEFFIIFGVYAIYARLLGLALFMFVFIVWGLYGIAATFPNDPKNVAYNILDILSKNFYGAFIFAYALSVRE
jgi:hypothetical protein